MDINSDRGLIFAPSGNSLGITLDAIEARRVVTNGQTFVIETGSASSSNVVYRGVGPDPSVNTGLFALDLQGFRTSATQTASGPRSSILGGAGNTASGSVSGVYASTTSTASADYSLVIGSFNSTASAPNSAVISSAASTSSGGVIVGCSSSNTSAGGAFAAALCTVSGQNSVVLGGSGNFAGGLRSAVLGGQGNVANNQYAVVIGGQANIAAGQNSTTIGGSGNNASGNYSIAMGRNANVNHAGSYVLSDSSTNNAQSSYNDEHTRRFSKFVDYMSGGMCKIRAQLGTTLFGIGTTTTVGAYFIPLIYRTGGKEISVTIFTEAVSSSAMIKKTAMFSSDGSQIGAYYDVADRAQAPFVGIDVTISYVQATGEVVFALISPAAGRLYGVFEILCESSI